jgi:CRISPR-associated endonuclease Csn1
MNVIPIKDQQGHAYKAYKGDGNYCYDIFANDKGKWIGEVVSRFAANQPGFDPSGVLTSSGEPLIMRLRVGDMLVLDHEKPGQVLRVVKLSTGQIVLAGHHEAGSLKKRDAASDDPFKYLTVSPGRLQAMNARVLIVDPGGRHFQRKAGNEK